tara:strand:- start:149 stop:352 length:204 start_codon:yes stop_codon:yes gene_type:complete
MSKIRNKQYYKKFDYMCEIKETLREAQDKLFGMDYRIDGNDYLVQDERVYGLEIELEELDKQLEGWK